MLADSALQAIGLGIALTLLALLVVLRHQWSQREDMRPWSVMMALAFISIPVWVPLSHWFIRPLIAGFAVVLAMKVAQLQVGLVSAEAKSSVPRFLAWLLVPPRTRWMSTPLARSQLRRQGLRRWGRAVIKLTVLLLSVQTQARQLWPWPLGIWAAGLDIYFILSGLADVVTGFTLLLGFATDEVFAAPFIARSPADFWGHRWNLFVGGFLRRFVFAPLARGGHPYRGAMAVFLASGLAHEYFVYVSVDEGTYEPGYMLAFFALQGVAVMAGAWWRAHLKPVRFAPHSLKVAANLLWLAATAPLFVWPIRGLLAAFESAFRW